MKENAEHLILDYIMLECVRIKYSDYIHEIELESKGNRQIVLELILKVRKPINKDRRQEAVVLGIKYIASLVKHRAIRLETSSNTITV